MSGSDSHLDNADASWRLPTVLELGVKRHVVHLPWVSAVRGHRKCNVRPEELCFPWLRTLLFFLTAMRSSVYVSTSSTYD